MTSSCLVLKCHCHVCAGKMQVVKSGSSASLEWTPQTAVPGTPAIVAYAISAVKDVTAAPLEKVSKWLRPAVRHGRPQQLLWRIEYLSADVTPLQMKYIRRGLALLGITLGITFTAPNAAMQSGFVKILDPKTTKTSLMFDGAASSYTYEVRSLSSDAGSLTNVKYGPAFEVRRSHRPCRCA